MKTVFFSIEILEARIAPALAVSYAANNMSASYFDVDGDLVTIKYTQPVAHDVGYQFSFGVSGVGEQLTGLDLTGLTKSGVGISITAKQNPHNGVLIGDGLVNVGFFNALNIDLGAVTVGGDVAKIRAGTGGTTAIKSLTVNSLGEYGLDTGAPNIVTVINGGLGSLTVKSNVRANLTATTIGPVTIGGSLIGGAAASSGEILGHGGIGAVKIAGNIEGGGGDNSGSLQTDLTTGNIGNVTVGGSILGTSGDYTGLIYSTGNLGTVTIGGSLVARDTAGTGSGLYSAYVYSHGTLKSFTIRGSLIGGIDPDPSDATPLGTESGSIFSTGLMGPVKIGRDVVGGTAASSGGIRSYNSIQSISIGGSLIGGAANHAGEIAIDGTINQLTIGGDLVGGNAPSYTIANAGSIVADRILSLTVGGSIFAGSEGGGTVLTTGYIHAVHDLGSVLVKGSLVGNGGNRVQITAGGEISPTATRDVAIKSLTVGGRVDHAWIFSGVNQNSVGTNGNAQIGAVKVNGDWIASDLDSGVNSTDGYFGNSNDARIGTGTISRIGSIVIGGQVTGETGTAVKSGFAAEEIGSFKYHGIAIALTHGARNDTFNLAGQHTVGPARTATSGGNSAVYVYEV